jgi:prepilin-type N-terminal cleavage/methylation domain-containing protein
MYERGNSNGFTLIEIVIATLIVVVMSGGIYGLTSTLVRLNACSDQVSRATVVAQNKIEELRGLPSEELVGGADSIGIFTRNWSVATHTEPTGRVLTVAVHWQNVADDSQQLKLSTVITQL